MSRKCDDLPEQKLYRVVQRTVGTEEWSVVVGYKRTYQTVNAARGMRTRLERENRERSYYLPRSLNRGAPLEFGVQVAPVGEWEILPDKESK